MTNLWTMGEGGWQQKVKTWDSPIAWEWAARNPQTPEEMDQLYIARHMVPRTAFNVKLLDPWVRWSDTPFTCLEVGASRGVQLATMRQSLEGLVEAGQYTGVDLAADVCVPVPAAEGCTLQCANANALPFDDNSFDLVFTSGCLMHVPPNEITPVIHELGRVSRWLVFTYEPWAAEEEYCSLDQVGLPPAWLRDWGALLSATLPDFKLFAAPRLQDVAGDFYSFCVLGHRDHPVGEWPGELGGPDAEVSR